MAAKSDRLIQPTLTLLFVTFNVDLHVSFLIYSINKSFNYMFQEFFFAIKTWNLFNKASKYASRMQQVV